MNNCYHIHLLYRLTGNMIYQISFYHVLSKRSYVSVFAFNPYKLQSHENREWHSFLRLSVVKL